jgi:hypothetical protein
LSDTEDDMPSTPVASRKLLMLLLSLAVTAFAGAAGAGPLGAIVAPAKVMAGEGQESVGTEQPASREKPVARSRGRAVAMPKLRSAVKIQAQRSASIQSLPVSSSSSEAKNDTGAGHGSSWEPPDPPDGKPEDNGSEVGSEDDVDDSGSSDGDEDDSGDDSGDSGDSGDSDD